MDINTYKEIIWRQLGAAIDMLENALRDCPEKLWSDGEREPKYWYVVYHTLFWLDFYSSDDSAMKGCVPGFRIFLHAPGNTFTLL